MKNRMVKNKKVLIEGIIALVVICVFSLAIICMVRSCHQVCDQIEQQGLKSIVEKVWEGENETNEK